MGIGVEVAFSKGSITDRSGYCNWKKTAWTNQAATCGQPGSCEDAQLWEMAGYFWDSTYFAIRTPQNFKNCKNPTLKWWSADTVISFSAWFFGWQPTPTYKQEGDPEQLVEWRLTHHPTSSAGQVWAHGGYWNFSAWAVHSVAIVDSCG